MDHIIIKNADILTAFDEATIGSKVEERQEFLNYLTEAINETDFNSCRQPGQAYIKLPSTCNWTVSAGVGKRTLNPFTYVTRVHREKVGLFLNRLYATEIVDNVAVVVYTLEAYMNDPDITKEEAKRVQGASHILVAVLASCGPPSPLSPGRFVHNLAGGNKEAMLWSADEIREKAKEISEYSNDWCVVAD